MKNLFVLVLLVAAAFGSCVNTQHKPIGGQWEIVTEISEIPDAGGHHPFLHRNVGKTNIRVDTDTYRWRFVAPDAVLWIGIDNGGLWIATGDHEPLLLRKGLGIQDQVPPGDPVDLGSLGKYSMVDLVTLAGKKPLLTSSWKPPREIDSWPITLPK